MTPGSKYPEGVEFLIQICVGLEDRLKAVGLAHDMRKTVGFNEEKIQFK